MSGNGVMTGMIRIIIKTAQNEIRRVHLVGNIAFCVAVGTTSTATSGRRIGIGTNRLTGMTTADFASFSINKPMYEKKQTRTTG
jgi:uncharacterized membrane protein YedE/YeeE